MTIDEAIKVLTDDLRHISSTVNPDLYDAQKLAIEALKYVETSRDPSGVPPYIPLPGETQE